MKTGQARSQRREAEGLTLLQYDRAQLLEVLGEVTIKHLGDLDCERSLLLCASLLFRDVSSQKKTAKCDLRGFECNEGAMEKGDLH
jgi:hypothetical protein